MTLAEKLEALRRLLRDCQSVLVCFSGGVDSSYLMAEAAAVLRGDALAFTAVSPSLPVEEREDAERLARRLGVRHVLIATHEVEDPCYAANPVNRCYFCKAEVYRVAVEQARHLGIAHVLDGFNFGDRSDHRPGRQAAREHGVRSPLDEWGFTKAEIREAARALDLPVWDKPAQACLSSRIPYGTAITPERLARVWQCERLLRTLGFRVCRVRDAEAEARIETAPEEIPRLFAAEVRDEILRGFRAAGFHEVAVDLDGYRTGSLNEAVLPRSAHSPDRERIVTLA